MGDMEVAVRLKYNLIDSWDAKHQHALILGFSLLILITYTIFLWFICSMVPSLLTTLLLLGSQIGLGLPATRAYYDFGVAARSMLKFYDSGVHNSSDSVENLSVNFGELSLLFERMNMQAAKYDKDSLDDLNDLAWFMIIVWSLISSIVFLGQFSRFSICPYGALVLIIVCLVCYYNGFRTMSSTSFEEELDHLEFYVYSHISSIDAELPNANGIIVLQVIKNRSNYSIVDFLIEYKLQKELTLEYHMGLSSFRKERFILKAPVDVIENVYQKMKEFSVVQQGDWTIEQVTTQSGKILRLANQKKILDISEKNTFILGLSNVKKSTEMVSGIIRNIVEIVQ